VTPQMAATGVETALRMLEGRWKMVIVFHLFDRGTLRFSELERAIPGVSQKVLINQLRELEQDGIVERQVYPQVPPKVEYRLSAWGQEMCPALDLLLEWTAKRPADKRP
jgi:DNA-binding HxlR family transcriptional regulator